MAARSDAYAPRSDRNRTIDVAVRRAQSTLATPRADAPLAPEVVTSFTNDSAGRVVSVMPYLHGVDNWFAQDPNTTSGLTWGYRAGIIRQADGTPVNVAAGTVALTDATTNYVEVSNTGVVAVSATRTLANKPIYKVVTAAAAITSVVDERCGFDFS